MANPDLAPGALQKPEPHRRLKAATARVKAAADKAIYLLAFVRDGWRCRACREYVGLDAHPHHLRGKAYTTTQDIATLCAECHGFLHVRVGGILMKLYGDADQRSARGVLNGLTLETRENDGTWRIEDGL